MPIDLESFREGYLLRDKICKLGYFCSSDAANRWCRSMERSVAAVFKGGSQNTLKLKLEEVVDIIHSFDDVERSLSDLKSRGVKISLKIDDSDLVSDNLGDLNRYRACLRAELKHAYNFGSEVISSLDPEGIVRNFVYPV